MTCFNFLGAIVLAIKYLVNL